MKRDYLTLAVGGIVSKVVGAAREILLARYFGTGAVADAYRGSLTLVLSPVHLLSAQVIQTGFVPLHARYAEAEPEKAQQLFRSLLFVFLGVGILLGLMLFSLAGPVVELVLRGFDPERARLAERMLRILAIGVPFYQYCSLLAALGSAQRDFAIPAWRAGMQNLGMVVMILIAAWRGAPVWMAHGFTLAYVLLALWATWHLRRRGLLTFGLALDGALVRETWGRLWRLLRPLVLVSVLVQANILIERDIASLIGPGSVAAVEYARFLTESAHFLIIVPVGLLGLSFFANFSEEETGQRTDRLLALLLLIMLPVSAFLLLNGRDLLALLYLRGRFDATSLRMTESVLWGLSAGLWAFSASHVLERILNARLRNRDVLVGQLLGVGLNVGCNLLLFRRLGIVAIGIGAAAGPLGSFLFYLGRLGRLGGRLPRAALQLLIALPPYLLLAWGLQRLARGVPGLTLQAVAALVYWGIAIGARRESRRLLLDRLTRGEAR